MTSQENLGQQFSFRPDFAARVLDAADSIVERRRRTRLMAATISAAVVAGVVTMGMWKIWMSPAPDTQRIPRQIASIGREDVPFAQSAQMGPLDFLFPDAASLAQFSEQYSEDDDEDALQDDAVFFPDGVTDAEVDGS
jgi:hypothetical protein